jgi:hypothetical protein
MDPQSIIIIVGVAVLLLERMFACLSRVKKSKCCGGELQLSSPPKKGLNDSEEREIQKKVEHILETITIKDPNIKRSSQNSTV